MSIEKEDDNYKTETMKTELEKDEDDGAIDVGDITDEELFNGHHSHEEAFEVVEDIESFASKVYKITNEIAEMLIEKNDKYGNSALEPKRIFSHADPIEQINVRIDDKLSRIANQNETDDEDAEFDLIGYLVLKKIAKG